MELSAVDRSQRAADLLRRLERAITDRATVDLAVLARQFARVGQLAGEPGPWRLPGPREIWAQVPADARRRAGVRAAEDDPATVVWTNEVPWPEGFHGPVGAADDATSASSSSAPPQRGEGPVPLDPFLRGIPGIDAYRNAAQREAVRAALRCAPGGVCHVVLPTGTGKSLVGLARGIASRRTTVVVVPTVALAIDQADKLGRSSLLGPSGPPEFAYLGSQSEATKAQTADRVRHGTQRVLFTSPEALVGPRLARAMHDLVAVGGLEALVIDESHLTVTWGRTFRPAFQLLGGLRRSLHETAASHDRPSFATITLTGTMTQATADGLRRVFPPFDGGREAVVGAAWVRAEPRFTVIERPSLEQARDTVVELLHHLPRPGIVYVNRVDEAENVGESRVVGTPLRTRLAAAGLRRWAAFTGPTEYSAKEERLRAWGGSDDQAPALDWMVATSAFGLGIDLDGVRTIVHLGVPESFDRFYQEVGRAGRDGRASLSVVVTYPGAFEEAAGLARESFLGGDKAIERWRRVYGGAVPDRPDLRHLHVRSRTDGGEPTPLDLAWNIHLVRQLEDAEAIQLLVDPSTAHDGERDTSFDELATGPVAQPMVVVGRPLGLINPGTADDYDQLVAPARDRATAAQSVGARQLRDLVQARQCAGRIVADAYAVDPSHGDGVHLAPVARGCPACGQSPCVGVPDGPWTFGFDRAASTAFPASEVGALHLTATLLILVATAADVEEAVRVALRYRVARLAGDLPGGLQRSHERELRRRLGWILTDPDPIPHPAMTSLLLAGSSVRPDVLTRRDPGNLLVVRPDTRVTGERFPIAEGGPHLLRPTELDGVLHVPQSP